MDGRDDGLWVTVGSTEGTGVGTVDGDEVGTTEGVAVGTSDGTEDGPADGEIEGTSDRLGELEGVCEGARLIEGIGVPSISLIAISACAQNRNRVC